MGQMLPGAIWRAAVAEGFPPPILRVTLSLLVRLFHQRILNVAFCEPRNGGVFWTVFFVFKILMKVRACS